MKKKLKENLNVWISFMLIVCMAASMLPSVAWASGTDEPKDASVSVIEGFAGCDCYGTDPWQIIENYTSEKDLPESVTVNLSGGESRDINVTWELLEEDVGSCRFQIRLPEGYKLSEALEKDIAQGQAHLPWILANLYENKDQTFNQNLSESETVHKDVSETESESSQGQEPSMEPEPDSMVITAFLTAGASVTLSKGSVDEVLAVLPETVRVTLGNGLEADIPALWECTDDYEHTEYDLYTFNYVLPQGYSLGSGLTDWDLPYWDVHIADMSGKEERHSWTPKPEGTVTIDQALGVTKDIVQYLEDNAQLYLGTPYNGAYYDEAASGTPGVGMNCTGFVGHVLMACGGDLSKIMETDMPSYLAKTWTNLSCWEWWIDNNPDIISYCFDSTAEALASGILEKGDIIIYEPDVSIWNAGKDAYGNNADCHIGFFWGDSPDENKFWHSSHETKGIEGAERVVYAGTNPGNQISQLAPKCVSSCYVVKTTHPSTGFLQLQKSSSDPSVTDGNGCYSLKGAVYGVYTDPGCSKESLAATLTTDEKGISQTVELDAGTYYVKETKASSGYAMDTTCYTVTVENKHTFDVPVVVKSEETPLNDPLAITLKKIDGDSGTSSAQGAGSLAGAQFTIRYYDGFYEKDHLPDSPERTWIIQTLEQKTSGGETVYYARLADTYKVSGDDFYYINNMVTLPLGTITVEETKAPSGYTLEGGYLQPAAGDQQTSGIYAAQIREHGSTARLDGGNEYIVGNFAGRGGVSIQKTDKDTGLATPEGDASLAGAVYAILNQNDSSVVVEGHVYGKGEEVLRLTTDASGKAGTQPDTLPFGNYTIVETDASEGYLIDQTAQNFTISQDRVILTLSDPFPEEIIRGGIKIQKRDAETFGETSQGSASLSGAEFSIINQSANPVYVDGVLYKKGETVAVIVTDENGIARTSAELLPYGTYEITETKAPQGYLAQGTLSRKFTIESDNVIVDLTDEDHSILNQVIRGDFQLTKIDSDTQNTMAGIPFRITSNTTGESHTFMTDANGFYSSSSEWNLHSYNTNGGNAEDGLWFGLDTDGSLVPVDDTLGALPFDTYTIEELRCKENENKILYTGTLTISRNGYRINMGNIENDSVNTPVIYTCARDGNTGSAYSIARPDTVIVDTVTYTGLTPGKEYVLQGTLMNQMTGEPVLDHEGKMVTGEQNFKAILENGTADVEFVFDASGLAGADVVVFEKLICEGEEVASHENIQDEGQTIHFPKIHTTARDASTETNVGAAVDCVTIIDTVSYENLQSGRSYTLTGTLMDKETGMPVSQSGREITVTKTFVPKESDGTVDMEFDLDASVLAGKSVVVFERMSCGVSLCAAHEDIEDEGQTIYFPAIKTTAADGITKDHVGNGDMEDVTIIDTVDYSNLLPGKEYTITGTLMDKDSQEPLMYKDQMFTQELTFTPKEACGSVELTFTIPGKALTGKTVVAFEQLEYKGVEVSVHKDINDKDQTVYYPQLKTSAKDSVSGTHQGYEDKMVTIIDTVEYTSLAPGKTYTVSGILMDKASGEPYLAGGKQVAAEVTFTPDKSDGTLELTFTFSGTGLTGHTLVVFETLSYNDLELAGHTEIDDQGQTVDYPRIYLGTTATDLLTETHQGFARRDTVIADDVVYKGAEPGQEYTIKGTLIDKDTGKPYLSGGTPVTAEKTFTAHETDGNIRLEFTFDGSELGGTTLVVFEALYYGEAQVAGHEDLTDEGQSVTYPEITLKTEAVDQASGSHEAQAGDSLTIVDTVAYTGLIPGKEYTMTGILMDKSTGTAFLANGNEITSKLTFTPQEPDGSVEMAYTFNGSHLDDKALVVFESLYYGELEIGTHKDINDASQTVKIALPEVPVSHDVPKTGIGAAGILLPAAAGCMFISAGAVGLILFAKRRRREKQG